MKAGIFNEKYLINQDGKYEGYHNSLDTKAFMDLNQILESVNQIDLILQNIEYSANFRNLKPQGEVQLGKRGLYPTTNSPMTWNHSNDNDLDSRKMLDRILTILSYSDGKYDMIDISRKLGCSPLELKPIIDKLESEELLAKEE